MSFSIEQVSLNKDAFAAYCCLRNQLWPMGDEVCEREAVEILGDSRGRFSLPVWMTAP